MRFLYATFFHLFCLVRASASTAQTDSPRYIIYQGGYFIGTTSFPVEDVTVFAKDTALLFSAGGAHGLLKPVSRDRFSFSLPDYGGNVLFKKDSTGVVTGIRIEMDGVPYEGAKKQKNG